jgi:hypothetical protein
MLSGGEDEKDEIPGSESIKYELPKLHKEDVEYLRIDLDDPASICSKLFKTSFYRKSVIRNTDAKFCERSNNRNREDRCDLLEVALSVKIRIPIIGRALPKETTGG